MTTRTIVQRLSRGRLAALALLLLLGSGCATGSKERIAALEADNRSLRDQLGRTRNDATGAMRSRDELTRMLNDARREADALRAQLAAMPPATEPAAPGWTAVPGGAMIAIEDDVLFASGKHVLRDEARRTLDRIVSTLQGEYGDKDIFVFGHTDDRPIKKSGWADNWQLSTERALAVVRYLKEHGVTPNRLVAAGCGEHRPRAENVSEANRTANRRVEIFAIDRNISSGRQRGE
ncbi:MAG: OmpA family protein [Planctomycetes bacterium]|nr:OmpA family protein [Planctomycetota bacterium]